MLRLKSVGLGLAVLAGLCAFSFSTITQAAEVKADEDILITLNTRYQNTVADSDGNPAYYCSGILLSVDNPWQGGVSSANGAVSFSYIRQDMAITKLYSDVVGYIFKDQESAITEGATINAYYAYELDAVTDAHPDSSLGPGCGRYIPDGTFYNSCSEAGVTSIDTYLQYFHEYVWVDGGFNIMVQC